MEELKANEEQTEKTSWTPEEFEAFAAAVHGSLALDEILVAAVRALPDRFPVRRVTLAQERPDAVAFTSVERGAGSAVKRVLPCPQSRIVHCLQTGAELFVDLGPEPDPVEESCLAGPETTRLIYLPLTSEGSMTGVVVVGLGDSDSSGASGLENFRTLAEHLAIAIRNSDTHYHERRRSYQLRMINEIARRAVELEELEDFFSYTAEYVRRHMDYRCVQIWTHGPREQNLILRSSASRDNQQQPESLSPAPMVLESLRQSTLLCNNNLTPGTGGSQLAVPIRLRDKLLGILNAESDSASAFPNDDLKVMEALASLIASSFDNLRHVGHAQQSNQYMQALLESVKDFAILSTDLQGYVLTCSAGTQAIFHRAPQDILGKDLITLFTDSDFQHELARYVSRQETPGLDRSKVVNRQGDGEIFLDVTLQRVQDPARRTLGFVCIARDVTENVRLHEELSALSLTDELTGLYNQRSFFAKLTSEIDRARRYQHQLALCFFDLDGFKQFNDTHGHLLGSQVLRETAKLLRSIVRSRIDMCYRYGGDEFIVILPETGAAEAKTVAERIRSQLYERFEHQISASLGIAEYSLGTDAKRMVVKADEAMYKAKENGGNCTVVAD